MGRLLKEVVLQKFSLTMMGFCGTSIFEAVAHACTFVTSHILLHSENYMKNDRLADFGLMHELVLCRFGHFSLTSF